MARRVSFAVLGTGLGLTLVLPVVGIMTMVTGAVGLAIALEDDLLFDELGTPGGWLGRLHIPVRRADVWTVGRTGKVADVPPEVDVREPTDDRDATPTLLIRCDGCGEFVACDPTDIRGTLGEDRPLCRGCRISERAAGRSPRAADRR
jgi:hypothetical protein